MKQAAVTVDHMIPQIMEILETFGYEKYTLWGDLYRRFTRIRSFYQKKGAVLYDPEITREFATEIREAYQAKNISKWLFNKLCRAAAQMNEFYETGGLKWSCDKRTTKYKLGPGFEPLLDLFLLSKEFHANTKWDFAWAIRKYLHFFEQRGIHKLSDVTIVHVRQFIIETATVVKDGSLHNLLCYIRQFHMFLKASGESAPDCTDLLS